MPATSECVYCSQIADAKPCDCHGERPPFGICDACRALERQPQGEAVRLFTPAPAQMPGQTVFGLSAENPGT
jgi:hypothetical protein